MPKISKKFLYLIISAGVIGGIYFFQFVRLPEIRGVSENQSALVVDFFDIGQGDSALIRTPAGDDILVDGGPDNSVLEKLGERLPFFDRDIELMILTHPHSDHVTGLVAVLKRYQVKKIMMTGALHTAPDYLAFLAEIKKQNIPVEIIARRQEIKLPGSAIRGPGEVELDPVLQFIFPNKSLAGLKFEELNNSSIVFKLIYGRNSFLFTGDFDEEESLVKENLDLRAEVLKIGHHGSNNANDENFLKAVQPKYAVISVGADNTFGHPHYRVLRNLEKLGAKIFRTDQDGDVMFLSDGKNLEIEN